MNTKTEPVTQATKHEPPMPPAPKPGLDHILAELGAHLQQSPDRRALAVIVLRAAMRMAVEAGWHEQELAALRAWPRG